MKRRSLLKTLTAIPVLSRVQLERTHTAVNQRANSGTGYEDMKERMATKKRGMNGHR